MKYILTFLFFVFACKGTIDSSQKKSILKILSENQKIYEQLTAKSDFIPDTKALFKTIQEAESINETNVNLKKELELLEMTLSKINTNDNEVFFESMSRFSEKLTDILKANEIQTEYHKFYCPMVSKYWIAKGEKIQNPYAPEMRDCGELVK